MGSIQMDTSVLDKINPITLPVIFYFSIQRLRFLDLCQWEEWVNLVVVMVMLIAMVMTVLMLIATVMVMIVIMVLVAIVMVIFFIVIVMVILIT